MKKLFSLLLAFVAASFSFTANALTLKFNVDNPERVKFEYNGMVVALADDGTLTLEKNYGNYSTLYVKAKSSEYTITACTCSSNTSLSFYVSGSDYYAYPQDSWDNSEWNITTANLDDLRTASCIMVIVGDVNKVKFQRYNRTEVTLSDTTTIKYNPSTEVPFAIAYNGYGANLYKVEINNGTVTPYYGTYNVTPKGNATDTIFVTTDAPADAKVSVTLNFVNDGTSGCVDSVLVNGEKVSNWADADFSVAWGAKVDVYFNATDYSIKYKWSTDSYWNTTYSSVSLNSAVNDSYTLNIDATKYQDYQVTLNVTKPELMTLTVGSKTLVLTEGSNDVTFNTGATILRIAPKTDCYIVSVVDNAGMTYSGSGNIEVDTKSLTSVTIVADSIKRDKQFVLYVDDMSKTSYYYLTLSDNSQRFSGSGWQSGYNIVNFAEAENKHTIYIYNNDNNGYWYAGYKNGVALEGSYNNQFYGQTIADGDVFKVFLAAVPETYEITLELAEELYEAKYEDAVLSLQDDLLMYADILTSVDWSTIFVTAFNPTPTPMQVLQGTQIDLNLGAAADVLAVKYNEQVVTPVDGVCTLTITASGAIQFISRSGATALQQAVDGAKAAKVVRDGCVMIIRGEEVFDILGNAVVK